MTTTWQRLCGWTFIVVRPLDRPPGGDDDDDGHASDELVQLVSWDDM